MLDCNFFEVTPADDLIFFFESSEGVLDASTLYLTRQNKIHLSQVQPFLASVEIVNGKISDGLDDLIFESARIEIISLGGYLSDATEPGEAFEFITRVDISDLEFTTSHLVLDSGYGYAVHIRFLQGYLDEDIEDLKSLFKLGSFKPFESKRYFGDILDFQITERNILSRIGTRYVLNAA